MRYRDLLEERTFRLDDLNPRAGVSWRLTPTTVVRGAWFRQLNTNFRGDSINPPTVAGFAVARNELPTARRKEYNVGVEHSHARAFLGAYGFFRETTAPFLLDEGSLVPEADASGTGGTVYVNWIVSGRATVFADNAFVRIGARAFDRYDNLARLGINLIHPRGFFLRLTGSYVTQRFTDTSIADLPRSDFLLMDVDASYEFAGKRGLASLRVTNALDRSFSTVIESVTIDAFIPDRRAVATFRWRLW
jgi:hypothetical protein